ncbi:MAG: hypothetical protein KDA57_12970 [Planctomycetales bacterium]|nr:hypothetical protein [Planctomycetales bacterium]
MRQLVAYSLLFLSFFVCVTACVADDSSPEKYQLRYKFELGEVMRYHVKHTADIRSTIEGTSQQAESQSESIKVWKVTDVLPNGEIEFVHLVESVRMSNRVPNRAATHYDSEKDKTPPPGFEQAARAVGVPLSVVRITPAGEIVGRQEKHPQPPASDDLPITLQFSDQPVALGEQWDATYDVPAERKSGAKLLVRTRRVCTLEKVETGVATVRVEYQILTPVSPYVQSQLVQRMTKGNVRFDIDQGRIISQQLDADQRVLGFAGNSSSMHYISRYEERLLKADERLASKP